VARPYPARGLVMRSGPERPTESDPTPQPPRPAMSGCGRGQVRRAALLGGTAGPAWGPPGSKAERGGALGRLRGGCPASGHPGST
jgi:hypothetical protein